MRPSPIRVLAIIEASSVTGPAKNLIEFCRWTQSPQAAAAGISLSLSIATFTRQADPSHDDQNRFVQAVRQAGVPLSLIRERGRFDTAVIGQIRALLQQIQPHILQTHNVKSGFLASIANPAPGPTWLAFQHGYTTTNLRMLVYNQLDRWTLRRAHRVITVCQAFTPKLISYGVDPSRVRVLHNSVVPVETPTAAAERLGAQYGIGPEEPVILTIGRLSKEKGHHDLVEALAGLHRDNPSRPWKALFVGDGPEKAALEQRTARHNLQKRLIWAGFHSQVQPFYALATLFTLPSHSEGSSNVLLESMAARVPVAATRVGGNPEIVSHEETALLVPARDPQAMAQALARLLDDPDLRLRLAEAAFTRAGASFSPQAYRHNLAAIYDEALASSQL